MTFCLVSHYSQPAVRQESKQQLNIMLGYLLRTQNGEKKL